MNITTRYQCRPGSNAGAVVARAFGRRRQVLAQEHAHPHRAAAAALLEVLTGLGFEFTLGPERVVTDDGQLREHPLVPS